MLNVVMPSVMSSLYSWIFRDTLIFRHQLSKCDNWQMETMYKRTERIGGRRKQTEMIDGRTNRQRGNTDGQTDGFLLTFINCMGCKASSQTQKLQSYDVNTRQKWKCFRNKIYIFIFSFNCFKFKIKNCDSF